MRRAHFVCLLHCFAIIFLLTQARAVPTSKAAAVQSAFSGISTGPAAHSAIVLPSELNAPGVAPRIKRATRHGFANAASSQASGTSLFMKKSQYVTAGATPSSITVADVNGDGKPDEIVLDECTSGNNESCVGPGLVNVMLGNGDGTFQKAKTYESGGYSAIQVVAADFNRDGKLDLAVLNTCLNPGCEGDSDVGSISILFGNGDGTFQPARTFASAYYPSSMSVGDINGDGKVDLVVSYFCDPKSEACLYGAVEVYLGKGDGTFHAPKDFSSGGYITEEAVLGDVNGDGKLDVVVANCGSPNCFDGTVGVLLGNGDGTFQTPQTYSSGGVLALAVAIGDVNGDGKPDVVVDNDCFSPFPCSQPVVGVLLGNGDGTLQPAQSYNAGGYACFNSGYCPVSIALADINGDGKLDVVAPFNVLLGNGDGTFQPPESYSIDPCRRGEFVVKDVNGDGKPDISIANYYARNGCSTIGLTVLLNVSRLITTTSLVSSENPAFVAQTVTYTATVASQYIGKPSGSIIFKSGSTVIATVPLVDGQASTTTSFNSSGSQFITATYIGDVNNASSMSAALKQAVHKNSTSVTVTSSMNPSSFGEAVLFTAKVSAQGAPTGTVAFHAGQIPLGTAPVVGNTASLATTTLPVGVHVITGFYSGDAAFHSRASAGLVQVVTATP